MAARGPLGTAPARSGSASCQVDGSSGTASRAAHSSSGISISSSSIDASRSPTVRIPTIVEVIRGSRVENCRAAAANGTPASAHSLPISFAASINAGWRLAVRVPAAIDGPAGQHAAAVRCRVEHAHPVRGGEVEQRVRAAIDQGVPVVGDDRLEVAGLEEAGQQVDGSARQAEVPDQAFVAGGDEGRDRTVGGHGPLPRGVLGIVEEDDRQVSEAETVQALGDRLAHPGLRRSRRSPCRGPPWSAGRIRPGCRRRRGARCRCAARSRPPP